jgi:hypothetical protein
MRVFEEIEAWGHCNITAGNEATFEITKEDSLTKRGDCIVGVRASKGACELCEWFKRLAGKANSRITLTLKVDELVEVAVGRGSPRLTFKHPTDLVARKSSYTCERTLMIEADKAAADFSNVLIQSLKDPHQRIEVFLTVEI